MSRYSLQPRPCDDIAPLSVAIGWDPPLATFFAIVHREPEEEDADDTVLLWVGTSYGHVQDVDAIVRIVEPFAVVSDTITDALLRDRQREGSRPRALWMS